MDIFKLFFNHDQRLDKLVERDNKFPQDEKKASLEDFMTPTPTFSKFYLTGTRLPDEKFGLNKLENYDQIVSKLEHVLDKYFLFTPSRNADSLTEAVTKLPVGSPIILSSEESPNFAVDLQSLTIDDDSNVGHRKDELWDVLQDNHLVMYKEKAHNGFDLHLFSKENIYPELFHPLQELVNDSFRFFSINSKRMRSERHFYFETWTLDKPPHGAEEVFPDTVLRSK